MVGGCSTVGDVLRNEDYAAALWRELFAQLWATFRGGERERIAEALVNFLGRSSTRSQERFVPRVHQVVLGGALGCSPDICKWSPHQLDGSRNLTRDGSLHSV
ncbi:unnamed protein product [Vitrella brassicaformis CCMP3155]|uniref:Uncharacterized protein n=1 Tax=Vitrella brassicaformis (strain CCMP3155) TaxID=1169540 RepID=A0A0G4ETE7_VITBC|nr:unnamed protein product [Vitrella brassicaformis CCMP3155]|eukprot:CEM01719.1 unnamed protein product [Vitrella brassicaformis CCMP3155]